MASSLNTLPLRRPLKIPFRVSKFDTLLIVYPAPLGFSVLDFSSKLQIPVLSFDQAPWESRITLLSQPVHQSLQRPGSDIDHPGSPVEGDLIGNMPLRPPSLASLPLSAPNFLIVMFSVTYAANFRFPCPAFRSPSLSPIHNLEPARQIVKNTGCACTLELRAR